jgi:hemerythrin-like metal-binding protein
MAIFEWDSIYETGVASIDQQHRRLFDIANRLHDAWQRREGRETLIRIFDELLEYTVYHFDDEERVMRAVSYPDLARHHGYHEKLKGLCATYREQLGKGTEGIETRALEFVRMWLNAHVLGVDKEIGSYQTAAAGTRTDVA